MPRLNLQAISGEAGPSVTRALRELDSRAYAVESLFARVIKNASIVASHADLQNLDYASSGHTGFASSAQLTAHTGNTSNPHSTTLEQAITAGGTATTQPVFNGGIDLGTSGRIDSNVADAAGAASFLLQPTVAQTSGTDRYIFQVKDQAGNTTLVNKADGTWQFGGSGATGAYVSVQLNNMTENVGMNFNVIATGSGASVGTLTNMQGGAQFQCLTTSGGTSSPYGGLFYANADESSGTFANVWAGIFQAIKGGANSTTTIGAIRIEAVGGNSKNNCTDAYGILLKTFGTLPTTTNRYGIYIEETTAGSGNTNEVFIAGGGGIWFRDQALYIASAADGYLDSYADTDIRENVGTLAGSTVANAFKKTADTTVANTTTETSLVGTGTGTTSLPANFLIVGRTVRVHASGYYSDAAAPGTIDFRVRLGGVSGTVILDTTALTPAGTVSNQLWEMDAYFTCRTTGATGTVYAQGHVTLHDSTSASRVYEMVNTATVTIDTTAAQAVTPTFQWGTADAANTITCTNMTVEWL